MSSRAETPPRAPSAERDWWLRALLVLQSPRAVFGAMRDDSDPAAQARQEPLVAIIYLAGIAAVLATNAAGRLLDDAQFDALLVAVWAFFAGGFYGVAAYWVGGLLVHLGLRLAGARGTYRRARHLLGFAATPVALTLLLWPVRIAVDGSDVFRSGGVDRGWSNAVFEGLEGACIAWALLLLVVGIRTVNGWGWGRAAAAGVVPALLPALAFARAYGVI